MAKIFNRNIDNDAHDAMMQNAGSGIRVFAITPKGGWVIITSRNKIIHHKIPTECLDRLNSFKRAGKKILCVAFHPRGGNRWSIVTESGFFNRGIPDECHDRMRLFHQARKPVTFVAFPKSGNNAWVVLTANSFYARNIPDECYQIMRNIHEGQRRVKSVAFDTDNNGWVVLAGDYFFARNVDDELYQQLKSFNGSRWTTKNVVFDTDRRGWSVSANTRFRRRIVEPIRDYENSVNNTSIWQAMRDKNTPGVTVAAVINNRIAWQCGYGHLKKGEDYAAHPESLFQAASISKVITALGILRAERRGLLDLDDSVASRLTSWTLPFARGVQGTVTLRQLLSHSAGTNVPGFDGYKNGLRLPTLLQILDNTGPTNSSAVIVSTNPGTAGSYSGGGFEVLHQMLEDVTGDDFDDWFQRNVFSRIGMEDTSFSIAPDRAKVIDHNVAAGHLLNGRTIPGERNQYPESAAAGAYSTVVDLARMIIFINRGGIIGNTRSLAAAQIADLLTPQHRFLVGTNVQGLGVALSQRRNRNALNFSYVHGGTNYGFRSAFMGYPNRNTGVVVMTNGYDLTLRWDIANAVADSYGWNANR